MTERPDSATGGVDHLLSEAGDGPWWPEPPLEDWASRPRRSVGTRACGSGVPSFWLTNEAGDTLHFDANDAAALLAEVRRLRLQVALLRPVAEVALKPDGSHTLVNGYCPDCQGGCLRFDPEPVPFVEPSPFAADRP